jgi:uncharacterized protein (DUF305 family)
MPCLIVLGITLSGQQPALAQHDPAQHDMSSGQAAAAPSSGDAGAAMMAAMARMNQAMNGAPMTGDIDRDFVAMMIPHHQGAIDMCKVEQRHGKDPVLLKMCRGIVADQAKEIALMRRWQQQHERLP